MPDPARFMTEVLAMWTEADLGLRRAAIEAHFLDEVRLSRPDGEFTGHDALERFSALQRRFPGARFTLAKPPQQLGDAIRAYWFFGSPGKPPAVSGMDFVILDGGKARALYAFPTPADHACLTGSGGLAAGIKPARFLRSGWLRRRMPVTRRPRAARSALPASQRPGGKIWPPPCNQTSVA